MFRGISFDSGGAFTKAVPSLEGALTVFPPWLVENYWGFQGNCEFPSWAFFLSCPAAGLCLMVTAEEQDLPAQGSSLYLERKNRMSDWELHLFIV